MKHLTRYISVLLLSALLCACSPLVNDADIPESFTVYASFYPIYALSGLIIDEDIPNMTLKQWIQPQDGCLRSFELSDWDEYLISSAADAVILGGSSLETFSSVLSGMGESGPAVIQAMSSLVLKSGNSSETDSHWNGVNPWLFLSVEGALRITEAICANMLTLDEMYDAQYMNNMAEADARLTELYDSMAAEFQNCDLSIPVALAHEGLVYFADEWNLNTVYCIERESGTDLSYDERQTAFEALRASNAKVILMEQQSPKTLVTAFENHGFRVVLLDTLSTGTEKDGADGYFTKMLENARRTASALKK